MDKALAFEHHQLPQVGQTLNVYLCMYIYIYRNVYAYINILYYNIKYIVLHIHNKTPMKLVPNNILYIIIHIYIY